MIKVIDNTTSLIARFENAADFAVGLAGRDMLKIARPKTPKSDKGSKDGTLRQRTAVSRKSNAKYEVVWDKPYAAYQERGSRSDGTRKVRRYTTPGTGKGFAKNAAKEINDPLKFLRKAGL